VGDDHLMLRCRLLGHRYRFRTEGAVMLWECERDCDAGGRKTYDSPTEARRYAEAFDREDRDDLGRGAPVLGMFPLRLWHKMRGRSHRR
jgi:hypothetical protein